ncbi:type III-B CRISPR module-associated Cmr3 family protein [Desulfococcus multivorans]|uniref:CRISPR-associated protein, Cmr3 n=1 Tax=Desulfococcus multivorans DSM 2059 TaxID=1121405 RepID=S7UHI0_DESML|nr:type III-B CRISPR module-associated Cmr3 family protein [Desulfococcus multivorans]AQV01571.1 hypothetical protein B2D07_12935 [Desulfococcus multivorans]EPR33309.1 CRISPR-associated protein, Cmr3 [Desulfococcus multivorans DSM 2059]SKA13960.1 CRISPR-associated protein Cmr3 [Desulfococcus multivorans DSM 2059]
MQWYTFEPADTLLVKGAEPMEMGADHLSSHLFPPPPGTIAGALRTAVLMQNGISLADYLSGKKIPQEISSAIGEAGKPAPFDIMGPLFRVDGRFFLPAPYTWFAAKAGLKESPGRKIDIVKAAPIESPLIRGKQGPLLWAKGKSGEMRSIGGYWISMEELFSVDLRKRVYRPESFFTSEPRTGIALTRGRRVREGHLYTFTHVRLKAGVNLAFAVSAPQPLASSGVLRLGAEKRFGRYREIQPPLLSGGSSGTFLSLSMEPGTDAVNGAVMATGKIRYIGGWDLKKGFHKPMRGHFPAGSVFVRQLKSHWIEL